MSSEETGIGVPARRSLAVPVRSFVRSRGVGGENVPVQPPRGIEPLGHKLTRLVPHHASGCAQFYHAGNTRYAAFADVPFYYSAQASAASTPATAGGATFLMGMPF